MTKLGHVSEVRAHYPNVLDIAMDWSDHALWWPGKLYFLLEDLCSRTVSIVGTISHGLKLFSTRQSSV